MSNSLADLTGQPMRLRVAVRDEAGDPTGETLEYRVHPLDFGDIGALQRWIDAQSPDPYESAWEAIARQDAKGKPFNVAQQQFLLKNAAELAMRPANLIGTPEADRLLLSTEGLRQIILAGIRKGDPSFDGEAADRLVRSMTQADILRAYAASQMDLVISDPKAAPPAETPSRKPTGSGGSRRTRRAAKARRRGGASSTP